MEFKKYISTLCYLNEAQGYASPAIKTQIIELINQTNAEAFEDTGYLCFQLYNDLKNEFPSLEWKWNSPKDSFKKTCVSLSVKRVLTEEELKRIGDVEEYRQKDLGEEELTVCDGHCTVTRAAYANPYVFEGKPALVVSFELTKGKSYIELQEINPLIECLRNLLNNV